MTKFKCDILGYFQTLWAYKNQLSVTVARSLFENPLFKSLNLIFWRWNVNETFFRWFSITVMRCYFPTRPFCSPSSNCILFSSFADVSISVSFLLRKCIWQLIKIIPKSLMYRYFSNDYKSYLLRCGLWILTMLDWKSKHSLGSVLPT